MPRKAFDSLSFLPDPVPGEEGHYSPFDDVFGTPTSAEFRPSLQASKSKQRTMPFSPCVQHMKNADIIVQCEECEMWRLVYSKYKLTTAERATLNQALEEFTFTEAQSSLGTRLKKYSVDIIWQPAYHASSSYRATIKNSHKTFIAPIQVQKQIAVAGLPCWKAVSVP